MNPSHLFMHSDTLKGLIAGALQGPSIQANRWVAAFFLLVFSLLLGAPLLVLLTSWLEPVSELWVHIGSVLLPEYLLNTLVLVGLILPGCWLIGIGSAWIVTHYRWPGSRFWEWALVLPLASPAFVIVYTYTTIASQTTSTADPLVPFLAWLFSKMSDHLQLGFLMTLVLYPYIYLSARVSFYNQSPHMHETARLGGWSRWKRLKKISLPLARPMIMAGSVLVLMHILSEYATFNIMAVNTISTGIYSIWFGHGELATATQLAVLLMLLMLAMMLAEKKSRGRMRFYFYSKDSTRKRRLSGYQATLVSVLLLIPCGLGFFYPTFMLAKWSFLFHHDLSRDYGALVGSTLLLALGASLLVLSCALLLTYISRYVKKTTLQGFLNLVRLGYVMPGTVLAVGVATLGVLMSEWSFSAQWGSTVMTGTLFGLVFAYCVRFTPVGIHQIEAGMSRIKANLDESCGLLNMSFTRRLWLVHVPLLRRSSMTVLLLVFIEIIKEMPMTQVLRPVGLNTLAIRTMEYITDERLIEAAPYGLSLALMSIIPVAVLIKMTDERPQ